MEISLHLIVAVAHLVCVLLLYLLTERSQRRLAHPRAVRNVIIGSAILLVPANLVSILGGEQGLLQVVVLVLSLASLIAVAVMTRVLWRPQAPTTIPQRVLVVAARTEDVLLGVGGTITRLVRSGHRVHLIIATDDGLDLPSPWPGVASTLRLDLPELELDEYIPDLIDTLEARVAAIHPDVILTPSGSDLSSVNQAINGATLRAARQHNAILCFETHSITAHFEPQVFVDITSMLETKIQLLDELPGHAPYRAADLVAATSSYRGKQAKMVHAEAFEAVRIPAFSGVL